MPNTNVHGPKRAILYARVSTDEQARSGYSLPEDDTIEEHSSAADSLEPSRNGRSQGWKQVKDEGRQSPVTLLEYPPVLPEV